MGNLTLLCVARTEDNAALYGFAFGFNNSMSEPNQLVILLKAAMPSTPPSSLSSLNWSLVSLILWSKVQNIYSTSDLTNTACAASSTGVFTFISQQYQEKGGFRYDPTLGSGAPPPPSTNNFQQSDPYWSNVTLGLTFNWTTTITNQFPKLFYVPITANSTGTGGINGHTLVLSTLNNNTVLFAQETQPGLGFQYTGTLQTPLAYMQKIAATAYSNGRFYLIGVPPGVSSQQAVVLSMPFYDAHVSGLPAADLKTYNSTPINATTPSFQTSCLNDVLVTADVAGNSMYFVCIQLPGNTNTIFSIQNLATDTLIDPPITITGNASVNTMDAFMGLFDFLALTPSATSPPSTSKGYGYLLGFDGPHSFPLDGSGPFLLAQQDWITSIPGLDVNQVNNFSPDGSGGGGSSTLSGGAWAGIVIGILAFFTCVYTVKRRQRTILRNRAQARAQAAANKVNRDLQNQRAQMAGHVFPDLNGGHVLGSELKIGAIHGGAVSSSPLSPPPLRPRPLQSPQTSGVLSDNSRPVVGGVSQEQLRQTLQLSSHPKPRVATTTRKISKV